MAQARNWANPGFPNPLVVGVLVVVPVAEKTFGVAPEAVQRALRIGQLLPVALLCFSSDCNSFARGLPEATRSEVRIRGVDGRVPELVHLSLGSDTSTAASCKLSRQVNVA